MAAVENPGAKMHSMSLRLGRLRILGNDPQRARLGGDALEVEAGAVVGELDGDFIALLVYVERDLAGFRLARLLPQLAVFEPVVECVAQ